MIWFLAILFTLVATCIATTLLKWRGVKENETKIRTVHLHLHLHTERDLKGPFWDLIRRYIDLEIAALKEAIQVQEVVSLKEEVQTQDVVVCNFATTTSPEAVRLLSEDEEDWGPTKLSMRRDCRRGGRLAKPLKSGLRSEGRKDLYRF